MKLSNGNFAAHISRTVSTLVSTNRTEMSSSLTLCSLAIVVSLALVTAQPCGLYPKPQRGLRCTQPFCDFGCLRQDSGSTFSDFGADLDLDEEIVSATRLALDDAILCAIDF